MSLLVLEPGLASRLVDHGRPRTRSFGVPLGGAADRRALALGNALVGNPPESAALEIALTGPRLHAEVDLGCVVFGAPFELMVISACGLAPARATPQAAIALRAGHTFTLHAGEELRIGGTRQGVRAYFCVRGGFHAPMILDSRSALEPLRAGDRLACASSTIISRYCPALTPLFPEVWTLAVLPGLQASWFDETAFYEQTFVVTAASDRMGLRLRGNALALPDREMVSEPIGPGAVQITREGQAIVLGVDGQTIGGYPKIAQVIQADLDALGQMRPGQRIRFVPIVMDEAIRRDRQAQTELRHWTMRLRLSLDAVGESRTLPATGAACGLALADWNRL